MIPNTISERTRIQKKNMYPNIDSSPIYNSQDKKATEVSMDRRMEKLWYVYGSGCHSATKRRK